MAIYKGNKPIVGHYLGNRAIATIYRGARLIWQAVNSCFGSGFWINLKPWSNEDGWRNAPRSYRPET